MPTVKRGNKWYYGSKGPFPTKKKADEVGVAIRASQHSKKKRKRGV